MNNYQDFPGIFSLLQSNPQLTGHRAPRAVPPDSVLRRTDNANSVLPACDARYYHKQKRPAVTLGALHMEH
jgi:hypothetical protein